MQFEHNLEGTGAWGWLFVIWFTLVVAAGVFCLVFIFTGPIGPTASWAGVCAILGGPACYAYHRLWKRCCARADRAIEALGRTSIGEAIDRAVLQAPAMFRVRMLRYVANTCGRRGLGGVAIRICPSKHRDTIVPLKETFEPKPLDEAETAFEELQSASGVSSRGEDASDRRRRMQPDERAFWARLRRNVSIRGGWGAFLCSGILLAVLAYVQGGVTNYRWWLLYLAAFVSYFVIPPGFWLRFADQWFLVPGGLILRSEHAIRASGGLHLFLPNESALCVAVHSFSKWMLVVADRHSFGRTYLTKDEALFVLRTWFSEVPPPSRELVDALL